MTNRLAAGLVAGALVLGLLVGATSTILATAGAAWFGGPHPMMGSGGWSGYGPMMGNGFGGMTRSDDRGGYGPMMDPDDMGPYASFMPDWMWEHMGWPSPEKQPGSESIQ